MNKVGVTYHPKSEAARRVAEETHATASARVRDAWIAAASDDDLIAANLPGTELLICCGGDGTILRAAHAVVPYAVALLGVNLGRIGFLMELSPAALAAQIDAVLGGAGRIETRAMVVTETLRAGEPVGGRFEALNDIAVGRASFGRSLQFTVSTDDTLVGAYRADGVIVATATGSTAYSLSVGGPILHPESREILVTPVAPHLAPANSVVLREGSTVDVRIAEGEQAILSVDGQQDMQLQGGDVIRVRASEHTARFLRMGPPGDFYLRAGRRLNWLSE